MAKKSYRSKHNRILLGICGGIAEYLDISPLIVRLLFLFSGIGMVAYIVLGCFLPENPML